MTDMPKVEGLNVPGRDIRELRPEVAEQIAQMAAGPRIPMAYHRAPNRDNWEPAPETASPRVIQCLDNPNIKWD